jgi:hypothetical protein
MIWITGMPNGNTNGELLADPFHLGLEVFQQHSLSVEHTGKAPFGYSIVIRPFKIIRSKD